MTRTHLPPPTSTRICSARVRTPARESTTSTRSKKLSAGKVRDNTLLSHDLFEGIFARSALATDIELFDDFPSHYEAAAARQHRWARGDWQLLPWIFGRGGLSREERREIKIPSLSRWKMLDNLRRTLSAPCMFLALIAAWLTPGLSPWMWTRFILAAISLPALLPFLAGLNARLGGISKRSHIRGALSDLSLGASQIGLTVTFLAYQAWLMSDAILADVGSLIHNPQEPPGMGNGGAGKAQGGPGHFRDLSAHGGNRGACRDSACGCLTGAAKLLYVAVPFVVLWCAAPAVAQWISRPPKSADAEPLPQADIASLRSISRRTWRFFENFVSETDRWLPPDNFQEDPKPVVAHRTSPTNIGLYLLVDSSRPGTWDGWARETSWNGWKLRSKR